jgi:hypothetical protein
MEEHGLRVVALDIPQGEKASTAQLVAAVLAMGGYCPEDPMGGPAGSMIEAWGQTWDENTPRVVLLRELPRRDTYLFRYAEYWGPVHPDDAIGNHAGTGWWYYSEGWDNTWLFLIGIPAKIVLHDDGGADRK